MNSRKPTLRKHLISSRQTSLSPLKNTRKWRRKSRKQRKHGTVSKTRRLRMTKTKKPMICISSNTRNS